MKKDKTSWKELKEWKIKGNWNEWKDNVYLYLSNVELTLELHQFEIIIFEGQSQVSSKPG